MPRWRCGWTFEAEQAIDRLVAVACWTILLSVMAHGLSAGPLSARYAARLAQAGGDLPEVADVPEPRTRHGLLVKPRGGGT